MDRERPHPSPRRAPLALALAALLAPALARAQAETGAAQPLAAASAAADAPGARGAQPGDVASPEAIVLAFYQSGSCAPAPDWDRFRALFVPGARLVLVRRADDAPRALASSVDEYVARAAVRALPDRFTERELAHRTLRYGDLVNVWSSYEARRTPDGAPPTILRGVNSFQLVRSDGRWWIAGLAWQSDLDAGPVPAEYLR